MPHIHHLAKHSLSSRADMDVSDPNPGAYPRKYGMEITCYPLSGSLTTVMLSNSI